MTATAAPKVTYPLQVNVLDYGAVPDGVTDCTEAFQKAVDALDPNPQLGGGTVVIPAADHWYSLSRSVIIDRERVHIVGESRLRSVVETTSFAPAFTFGLMRGTRRQTLSPDHWVDLHDLLDSAATGTGQQWWGYRTRIAASGDRQVDAATVSFPASPFAFGPPDTTYWQGVRQFTLDFVVRNNAGSWKDYQQLFGLVDDNGDPSPWFAQVRVYSATTVLQFSFRTTDGLRREIMVPIDGTQPVLRCSLQLDLNSGKVAAWIDRNQVTPDLSQINDGWPASPQSDAGPVFVPNWNSPFNLAALTPASVGVQGPGLIQTDREIDLTFGALRLSNVLQYQDSAGPQRTVAGAEVTDLDWLKPSAGEFARLPMNEPVRKNGAGVPDFQVPWAGISGRNGFGVFVSTDFNVKDTLGSGLVEKLTVNCGRRFAGTLEANGQAIAVGLMYGFELDDVVVQFGAQGLSSYNFGANYPIDLRHCVFAFQTDTAIYSYSQILHGTDLALGPFGRSALKAVRSNIALRDVFCSGSNSCESAVRLYESTGQFDNWQFDFEGPGVRDSYFWATLATAIGGPTQLAIRDCVGVNGDPVAAAVRLVSGDQNGGLATSLRNAGWCTIERSFTNYLSTTMQAVVAVDGPLWQGMYTGIPPARPPLAVTTAVPGASVRFGLGTVPAASSVPAVTLPGAADPILALPGLRGYYRADGLTVPDANGNPRPAHDGDSIPKLTDLSPAGNHGVLTESPAVYEPDAVNGLAALRFTGGWYKFPSTTGTTGAATVFLVTRGSALFETGNFRLWRRMWQAWSSAAGVTSYTALSDTDWVVYAARFSAGSARVLQSWVNGRTCDVRRIDTVGDVQRTAPTLGTIAAGLDRFTGLFSTAVVCAAALSDEQVDLVTRQLLHQHQIAV